MASSSAMIAVSGDRAVVPEICLGSRMRNAEG